MLTRLDSATAFSNMRPSAEATATRLRFGANHDYLAFGCCHTYGVCRHFAHGTFIVRNAFAQIALRLVEDGAHGVDCAVDHFGVGDFCRYGLAEQRAVAINLIFASVSVVER